MDKFTRKEETCKDSYGTLCSTRLASKPDRKRRPDTTNPNPAQRRAVPTVNGVPRTPKDRRSAASTRTQGPTKAMPRAAQSSGEGNTAISSNALLTNVSPEVHEATELPIQGYLQVPVRVTTPAAIHAATEHGHTPSDSLSSDDLADNVPKEQISIVVRDNAVRADATAAAPTSQFSMMAQVNSSRRILQLNSGDLRAALLPTQAEPALKMAGTPITGVSNATTVAFAEKSSKLKAAECLMVGANNTLVIPDGFDLHAFVEAHETKNDLGPFKALIEQSFLLWKDNYSPTPGYFQVSAWVARGNDAEVAQNRAIRSTFAHIYLNRHNIGKQIQCFICRRTASELGVPVFTIKQFTSGASTNANMLIGTLKHDQCELKNIYMPIARTLVATKPTMTLQAEPPSLDSVLDAFAFEMPTATSEVADLLAATTTASNTDSSVEAAATTQVDDDDAALLTGNDQLEQQTHTEDVVVVEQTQAQEERILAANSPEIGHVSESDLDDDFTEPQTVEDQLLAIESIGTAIDDSADTLDIASSRPVTRVLSGAAEQVDYSRLADVAEPSN